MSEWKAVNVRPALTDDLLTIADWLARARCLADSARVAPPSLRMDIEDPDVNVLIVQDRDDIAALGMMRYGTDDALVYRLDVDDRSAGSLERHVGACLAILRWFEASASAAGIGVIGVLVDVADDAVKLVLGAHGYRDFGNVVDGVRRENITRFAKDLWA